MPSSSSASRVQLTRRELLISVGAAGVAAAGGVIGGRELWAADRAASSPLDGSVVAFGGFHQAGIATRPPAHLLFAAYDLTATDRTALAGLMRSWTDAAARLTGAQLVGSGDSGEATGLSPASLTLTFGVGPGVFDDRFGLSPRRPDGFGPLPPFSGDELDPARCGGDLMVQACAEDQTVASHAIRQLSRLAEGVARVRWTQAGFGPPAAERRRQTPRNLLGFKDGTANPTPATAAFDAAVWVGPKGPDWLRGGTYLCARRVRVDVSAWDRLTTADQQIVIGRTKSSGAPLSGGQEHSLLDLSAAGPDGVAAIPPDSHVRLASSQLNDGATILRRGYGFDDGYLARGVHDTGLFFLGYVADIERQFVPIQARLAAHDRMNRFITTVGSATFAVLPGPPHGGFIGQTLLT